MASSLLLNSHDDVIKFSALMAPCDGNPPVTGGFPSQRTVTPNFDVFFYLCLNKWLSKQLRSGWCETPLRLLWRHCNMLFHFSQILYHHYRYRWMTGISVPKPSQKIVFLCTSRYMPRDAMWRYIFWSTLVLVMLHDKPLPNPVLSYCQLGPSE